MIYIFSGEINSGKTTRLYEYYFRSGVHRADGIISRKMFHAGVFYGYELERLSNGVKVPLAIFPEYCGDLFYDGFIFGPFRFSYGAFCFAERVISELLVSNYTQNIFLDEIGPLELEGHGFCGVLKKALQSDKNLYLCVRSNKFEEVVSYFGISQYVLL